MPREDLAEFVSVTGRLTVNPLVRRVLPSWSIERLLLWPLHEGRSGPTQSTASGATHGSMLMSSLDACPSRRQHRQPRRTCRVDVVAGEATRCRCVSKTGASSYFPRRNGAGVSA